LLLQLLRRIPKYKKRFSRSLFLRHTHLALSRRQLIAGAAAFAALKFGSVSVFAVEGDALYASLLKASVKPDGTGYNRVDYTKLVAKKADLAAVVTAFETVSPKSLGANDAKAFWINLYNAVTLKVIVDHYPVKSIKDIKLPGSGLFGAGPWSAKLVTVDGRALSLDDIEHKILRKTYKDPFVHYALNCASYSCPNLAAVPYTGANVAALMRENAKAYVNHPRGVEVKDNKIIASKIYSWYAGDFGGKGKLKDHWKDQASAEKATLIDGAEISSYNYDWSLNNA
jgi:Protein of unknown function, DUF547